MRSSWAVVVVMVGSVGCAMGPEYRRPDTPAAKQETFRGQAADAKSLGELPFWEVFQDEALKAFHELCRTEGIIPALESAHAVAQAMKMAPSMKKDAILLVNLSGRGDKDMHTVAERAGKKL